MEWERERVRERGRKEGAWVGGRERVTTCHLRVYLIWKRWPNSACGQVICKTGGFILSEGTPNLKNRVPNSTWDRSSEKLGHSSYLRVHLIWKTWGPNSTWGQVIWKTRGSILSVGSPYLKNRGPNSTWGQVIWKTRGFHLIWGHTSSEKQRASTWGQVIWKTRGVHLICGFTLSEKQRAKFYMGTDHLKNQGVPSYLRVHLIWKTEGLYMGTGHLKKLWGYIWSEGTPHLKTWHNSANHSLHLKSWPKPGGYIWELIWVLHLKIWAPRCLGVVITEVFLLHIRPMKLLTIYIALCIPLCNIFVKKGKYHEFQFCVVITNFFCTIIFRLQEYYITSLLGKNIFFFTNKYVLHMFSLIYTDGNSHR